MKLTKLQRLATVSAVALGVAAYSGTVHAAAYELDSGADINITVTADVMQTVAVTVTNNVSTGDVGIKQDAADTAQLVMAPDGTITEDLAGPARFVEDPSDAQQPAVITLTGAFPSTDIYVNYDPNADLDCVPCVNSGVITLTDVTDDLGAGGPASGIGTGVAAGNFATEGQATTDANGALTWNIGVTLTTVASANYYETGAYVGSFDMNLSY